MPVINEEPDKTVQRRGNYLDLIFWFEIITNFFPYNIAINTYIFF
jgi:hypothetical protein